jgi:hypothetical protein
MEIKRYWPSTSTFTGPDADGAEKATIHAMLRVDVFSYPGGKYGEAFTRLETTYDDHVYYARLPRAYSSRWFTRLAREFAWRVVKG